MNIVTVKARNTAFTLVFALLVSLFIPISHSVQKITAGTNCQTLNKKTSYKNRTYTCIKRGNKLVWSKGVAIKRPTPSATPALTPSATPAPTSAPTPASLKFEEVRVRATGETTAEFTFRATGYLSYRVYVVLVSDPNGKEISSTPFTNLYESTIKLDLSGLECGRANHYSVRVAIFSGKDGTGASTVAGDNINSTGPCGGQSVTPSPTPPSTSTAIPVEGSPCQEIGVEVPFSNWILKCWYQGRTFTAWMKFPPSPKIEKNAKKYEGRVREGSSCDATGDTYDFPNGYFECRYVHGGLLKWVAINDSKQLFDNKISPNGVDVCKLQNSAVPSKSGRDSGQLAGFPFAARDYFPYIPNQQNSHKALIVGVDFPELRGVDSELKKINDYDKKLMSEWYSFYSDGEFKLDVTSIDYWLHAPKKASQYSMIGTYDGRGADANSALDGITQEIIDLITPEIDLRQFQTIYLIFPDGERTLYTDWVVRNRPYKIKEGTVHLNFFGWGLANELMVTMRWAYYVHETLHDFPIIGHAPGNGWPFGIFTNQSGISMAMNPWEQFKLGWLRDEQIYCIEKDKLQSQQITLSPVEREDKKTKMVVVKLSETRAIVVEAHGIDKWSSFNTNGRSFPPGFYGVMAYVIDLNDAGAPPINDLGTSIDGDDGNNPNFPRWAYFQKIDGAPSFLTPSIWSGPKGSNFYDGSVANLNQFVALLGDAFTIDGVRIKLVATGDFETIEILKL